MKLLFLFDYEGKLFNRSEKAFYYIIFLFFISLFIPRMGLIPSLLLVGLLVISFLFNTVKEKLQLIIRRKEILLLLVFYLLHVISALFSHNKEEAISQLVIRIPVLLFPVAVGTVMISEDLKNRIIFCLSSVVTVVSIISLILSFTQYSNTGRTGYLYNDSLTVHFNLQSIYMAMLVNLSIIGFIYLLLKRPLFITAPGWIYAGLFILFVYHFLLASRSAMILLYGGLFLYSLIHIIRRRKYLEGITLLLGMFIGSFILFKFFPKTVQRFKELAYINYHYSSKAAESHYDMQLSEEQWNGANTRLALWKCGWELAQKNLLFGTGLGDRVDRIGEVYQEKNFTMALQTKKNVHNSYLDALLTFGIGGLILFFLTFVFFPLRSALQSKDKYDLFLVTAFAVSMLFEVYLGRSIGCMLAGFFYSFIAASRKPVETAH